MSDKNRKRCKTEDQTSEEKACPTPDQVASQVECGSEPVINDLREELKALKEQLKRMQAEYENFRKRKNEEYDENKKYVALELFKNMLPVLDNLERAYDAAGKNQDVESLQKGIELVVRQFKEILEKEGTQELPGEGSAFDPTCHEAIMREVREEVPEGIILEVLQKGYKFKDRILRPSLVKVSG
jgi:molecular chaperone GrpE